MRKREELSLTKVLNLEGKSPAKPLAEWETLDVVGGKMLVQCDSYGI